MKCFVILLFLLTLQMFSQHNYIEMTNEKGKVVIIKNDKRVKIVTQDGKRFFGRIHIINQEQVVLRKDTLSLSSIVKIQKRSGAKSALTTILIVVSSLAIPASLPLLFVDNTTAVVVFTFGLVGLPTGILIPVLGKNYNIKQWSFKIITP